MKNRLTIILLISVISLAAAVGGALYYLNNTASKGIEVPSFYGYTKDEVMSWMEENEVSGEQFVIQEEFSDTIDEGLLIRMSPEDVKVLNEGDVVTFVFSAGVDPSSDVTLISFEGMTKDEIESWCAKNKMSNVTYSFAESDTVEPNHFIKHNISAETISRQESVMFTIAMGDEVPEGNIVVPDFKTMSQDDITKWAADNKVSVSFNNQDASGYVDGQIIKQSVEAGKGVAEGVSITVTVAGKGEKAGTTANPATPTTTNTASEGMVAVENMVGKSEKEAAAMCKRINVLYRVVYVASDKPAGTVVDQDVKTGNVPVRCTLRFDVSQPAIDNYKERNISEVEAAVNSINSNFVESPNIVLYKWGKEVDEGTPEGMVLWMTYNAAEITGRTKLEKGAQIEVYYATKKSEETTT
ncbi:MAG: PASTA domain-containing protein, partial [Erysipelotrichaceae bacterium]|nr:PASTA domain-containing protein [Erysipelotrichaceae bacterium]